MTGASLACAWRPVDFLVVVLLAISLAGPAGAQSLDSAWLALEAEDFVTARSETARARKMAPDAAAQWEADLMMARINHLEGMVAAPDVMRNVVARGHDLWADDPAQLVEPLMLLSYTLAETGDVTASLAASIEALRLARITDETDLVVMALDALIRDLLNMGDPGAAEVLAALLGTMTEDDDRTSRLLLAIARADLGAPDRAVVAVLPMLPPDDGGDEDLAALWQDLLARLEASGGMARWLIAASGIAEAEAAASQRAMVALEVAMAARQTGGALAFDRAARKRLADLSPADAIVQEADLALLTATLAEGRPDLAVTWAERVAAVPAPVLAARPQDMLPPLHEVAEWLHNEGRLPQALRLAEAVAVLSPLRDGPGSEAVGRALVLLAAVQIDMGRLSEAGAILQTLQNGADYPPRIAILARLQQAALHEQAGRRDQALAALQEALHLLETTPEGARPDAWLGVLDALANHHAATGDSAAALAAAERMVAEVSARAAPGSPAMVEASHLLSRRQIAAGTAPVPTLSHGRLGLAGDRSPMASTGLSADITPLVEAAQALRAQGDLAGALARMDAALARLAENHPTRAALLAARGLMRLEAGQPIAALDDLRPATRELSQPDRREEPFSRQGLAIHVAAAMAAAEEAEGVAKLNLLTEAFQVAQRVNDLRAGEVLGRATARLYGDGDLGRAHESASANLSVTQAALLKALAEGRDGAAERAHLSRARTDLAEAEARLIERFPDYGAFAAARPVDLLSASRLLDPDEALVLFATVEGDAVPGRVFVITQDEFDSAELPPRAELVTLARRMRCAAALTDPGCAGANGGGTRGAFTLEEDEGSGFDTAPAVSAWEALLAPVEKALTGRKHLIVVPDRALVAMPFHLMVRRAGGGRVDWLIREHAITVVPNVAGLARLRDRAARPIAARKPFLGIGDPLIGAAQGGPLPYDCDDARELRMSALPLTGLSRSAQGLADPARVADLAALPDTRCELERAARLYGTPDALLLHGAATEAQVKALSDAGALADYRVLSFATHGLIAGEIGAGDAALVLTPPRVATDTDDGLLTAAEIAQLRLDAELVILSACNTAAGSGDGGEGLSGLASGFFLAGARSLLVSHWPVYSDAATRLTEAMLTEATLNPGISHAEALRRAMLALAEASDADDRQRHPAWWGPFMLVGEGA